MDNERISLILQASIFLIPINIYVIGDWLGTGVQWTLLRYQQTNLGTSLIPVTKDVGYVIAGIMSGRSGISILVWCAGAIMLTAALLLMVYMFYIDPGAGIGKRAPLLTILAGALFGISCMVQYGFSLNGPAGISMPLGVPVIIVIGWWQYHQLSEDRTAVHDEGKSADVQ